MASEVRIETERLILRHHDESDLDDLYGIMSDETILKHLGASPLSREETWRKILCHYGLWGLCGYGYLAIEHKSSVKVIGEVGLANFKRDCEPSLEPYAEMGWILAANYWGHGYAFEAGQGLIEWTKRSNINQQLACMIDLENTASIKLANKLGFVKKSLMHCKGIELNFLVLPKN